MRSGTSAAAKRKTSSRQWLTRALLSLAILAVPAWAVQPGKWIHSTEADYADGKSDGVVVTNLGDIKLSMKTDTLAHLADHAGVVNDIRLLPNGDLYIAAGPESGKLLRRRKDKLEEVANLAGEQIFAMQTDAQGRLLVAISSEEHTRIAAVVNDKLQTLVEIPEVRYVWDFLVDGGRLILATGTEGRVLLVDLAKAAPDAKGKAPAKAPEKEAKPVKPATKKADESHHDEKHDGDDAHAANRDEPKIDRAGVTEILNAVQANILCLARDRQGRIYAGTDTDGLVYRITLRADGTVGETFVVYDAAEPEIGAICVTADGTVYVGTADAEQARPGRILEPSAMEGGRPWPEEDGAMAPPELPNVTPKAPPQPAPGKPAEPSDREKSPAKEKPAGNEKGGKAPAGLLTPRGSDPLFADASRSVTAPFSAAPAVDAVEDAGESGPPRSSPAREKAQHAPSAHDDPGNPGGPGGPGGPGRPGIPRRPRHGMPSAPGSKSPLIPGGPGAPHGMGEHEGNAIYKITPEGFVKEVFRESVMILRIIEDPTPHTGERLLVATGNEGKLYRVDPAGGETTVIAHLETQQISALLREPDGNVLVATANPATLERLTPGFASEGTFTSIVLDATQISRFGSINLTGVIPKGTSVALQTRSGNVEDPDAGPWSAWSEAQVIPHKPDAKPLAPFELKIKSPPARFLQYRLTLKGDGKDTPVMHRVEMTYVMPNLKPVIASVHASYGDEPEPAPSPADKGGGPTAKAIMRAMRGGLNAGAGRAQRGGSPQGGGMGAGAEQEPEPQTTMMIEWEASDPNNDHLRYTLEYQPAGSKAWILIAKDLNEASFEWQTRRVPDGRYLLRVTASDEPDNTAETALTAVRVSDPVVVDNAPPTIENLKAIVDKNTVTITGGAKDVISPIQSVHYGLDSTEHWKPAKADSGIFDSTNETFTFRLTNLSTGAHVVTVRAMDSRGNPKYEAVTFEVKKEDVPKENGKK